LGVKELKTHHPEGSIVLYHMYTQRNEKSIVPEGHRILEKGKKKKGVIPRWITPGGHFRTSLNSP
jgi:hypothetical protein